MTMLPQVLGLMCVCLAGQAWALDRYNVRNFPDPIDNYQACGRVEESFICDPNNMLPESKVDKIDEELKAIYDETTVPCYNSGPRASRRRGYRVMVAVMPKMARFHTVNISGNYEEDATLKNMEARYFAYFLGKEYKWGKHSSGCNETVIVLYSAQDGVLYTSTQSRARLLLTDETVQDVFLQTLSRYYPFYNNHRVADAIFYMIKKYGVKLRDELAQQ